MPNEELRSQLLQLCTKDGTPEQARNAVYTLARLFDHDATQNASPEPSKSNKEALSPLLKTLTSPSRLTISSKNESDRVISILSALSALADCEPEGFDSDRGQKAVKFALESILMGRTMEDSDGDEDESEDEEDVSQKKAPGSSGKKKRRHQKHASPEVASSLLEDENLSLSCRRICAAIDFLVSYVRAGHLHFKKAKALKGVGQKKATASPEQTKQVFEMLTQIIRDKGLPPSNRDRRSCKARQDRAALRQCASIHLLRLCDVRLGLERTYLTTPMWHTLSEAFLDEESVVREALLEEFARFLRGAGVYGIDGSGLAAQAPPLRFVALVALCSDGDHGLENDAANANAANVKELASQVKNAVLHCVNDLRTTCDNLYAQCRAGGKESEMKFESHFKMLIMPEYMVPYALHLLSHRRETPIAADAPPQRDEEDEQDNSLLAVDEESQNRVLRKRLKLVFDPLVQSLGEGADNISFLLRMSEIVGKQYRPVDVAPGSSKAASSSFRLSVGPDSSQDTKALADESTRERMLQGKLQTICLAAQEVLQSYIKKDVNLSPYPGMIRLPASLFRKAPAFANHKTRSSISSTSQSSHALSSQQSSQSVGQKDGNPKQPAVFASPPLSSSGQKRKSSVLSSSKKDGNSHVHFSPEVEARLTSRRSDFGGMSPIIKSATPASGPRRSSARSRSGSSNSKETLGTTPPRIATIRSGSLMDASSQDDSPESHRTDRSPVVREEIVEKDIGVHDLSNQSLTAATDDAGRVTRSRGRHSQETLLSSDSSLTKHSKEKRKKASGSKRKSPDVSTKEPATAPEVPKQIRIKRSKVGLNEKAAKDTDSSRDSDDLDFVEPENRSSSQSNRPTSKGGKAKKTAVGSKSARSVAVAKKQKVAGKSRSKPVRSRR